MKIPELVESLHNFALNHANSNNKYRNKTERKRKSMTKKGTKSKENENDAIYMQKKNIAQMRDK